VTKSAPRRKDGTKSWIPNKTRRKMVLGDDLGLDEAVNLALTALVGRFSYRSKCSTSLIDWVKLHWLPLLGYEPEVFYLPRGWFGFKFLLVGGHHKSSGKLWSFDEGSLMLKRWWISFDPVQDYFQFRHLWVLLPGLPLNLWNVKALTAIGNALGRFIRVDDLSLRAPDRKLGRILVEVDIHSGLLETLDIQWCGHVICQKLDYLGLPFRCTFCRKTGHLRSACQGLVEEEESENSWLWKAPRVDSPGVDSFVRDTEFTGPVDSPLHDASATVTGKLKVLCPSFYYSLTSWEKLALDSLSSRWLILCYLL
jgi:hypothetical protein